MAEFSCPSCGVPVFSPPGATTATCPQCGTPAAIVLRPTAPRPAAKAQGKLLWVVLGILALIAMAVGLCSLAGMGEPKAVMASGGARPLSRLAVPIRARPIVSQRGRLVLINLLLTDADGDVIRSIELGPGRRMAGPKITVLDERGGVVHSGRLEYG